MMQKWSLLLVFLSDQILGLTSECNDTIGKCQNITHLCNDPLLGTEIQLKCPNLIDKLNRKRKNSGKCVDHRKCKSWSKQGICSGKTRNLRSKASLCPQMCNLCKNIPKENPYSVWFNSLDESVNPCQDFYQFTCGKYIKNNKPATLNSVISPLTEKSKIVSERKLELILDNSETKSTAIQKLRQYRNSCKNQSAVELERTTSLLKDINSLGGCPMLIGASKWNPKRFGLTKTLIDFTNFSVDELIVQILPDKMTDGNIYLRFWPASLIVKVPQLYNETKSEQKIQMLEDFLTNLINIVASDMKSNQSYATLSKSIKEVINLDKQFANILSSSWPAPSDPDEFEMKAKKIKLSELKKIFPSIDWKKYLKENARIPKEVNSYLAKDPYIFVYTIDIFKQLNNLISKTDKRIMANYLFTRYIVSNVPYLDTRFALAGQRFAEQLDGFKRTPNRDQDCLATIESNFPLVIDHLFVQKYFDAKSRSSVSQMVDNLLFGVVDLVSDEIWIQKKTKAYAINKLKKTRKIVAAVKDAIDPKLLDKRYEDVTFNIPGDSYRQMAKKVIVNNARRLFMNVVKPELYTFAETMRTTDTNAANIPDENLIFISSAISQTPVFNPKMPASINYGGLGFIIAHEFTHSIDNDGSKYDVTGKKTNWWDKVSKAEFQKRSNCLVKQYGKLKEKDIKRRVDGRKTLGENIADNGGIRAAFKAYQRYLRKNKDRSVPGYSKYTNEQSFFISAGVTFCQSAGLSHREFLLEVDVHSPASFRINTNFGNFPEFAKVFKCPLGSPMNLKEKCRVW